MVTLFASIAGFITSIIPELLKFLRDKYDKKHELEIMDRQIKCGTNFSKPTIDEIYIAKDIAETASLYNTYKVGISWVDALNGSVRPVLAYSFFALYSAMKAIQYSAINASAIAIEYMDILWNVDDQAIFAGIISFYFGQRTFSKINNKR